MDLRSFVREVPDFPKPGVSFKDISPLLGDSAAFALAVVTGFLLFSSSAAAYAGDFPFRMKMLLLVAAGINMVVFHLLPYRKVHLWDVLTHPPIGAKVMAGCSLALWIGIVCFGRWIGFTLN